MLLWFVYGNTCVISHSSCSCISNSHTESLGVFHTAPDIKSPLHALVAIGRPSPKDRSPHGQSSSIVLPRLVSGQYILELNEVTSEMHPSVVWRGREREIQYNTYCNFRNTSIPLNSRHYRIFSMELPPHRYIAHKYKYTAETLSKWYVKA